MHCFGRFLVSAAEFVLGRLEAPQPHVAGGGIEAFRSARARRVASAVAGDASASKPIEVAARRLTLEGQVGMAEIHPFDEPGMSEV
jgi:hypothetical protein